MNMFQKCTLLIVLSLLLASTPFALGESVPIPAVSDRMLGNDSTDPKEHDTGTTAWPDSDGRFSVGDNYVEREGKVTVHEWRGVMIFEIAGYTAEIKTAPRVTLQLTVAETMGDPYDLILAHLTEGHDGEVKISDYHADAKPVGDTIRAAGLRAGDVLTFDVTEQVRSDLRTGVSLFRVQVEDAAECPNGNKMIDAVKFYDASSGKNNPELAPQLIVEIKE
ncbi:MAG: hypothetical protein Q7Q73_06910 [Verrucomicrobiota bacterium JB024]|nr:hypothetical protein [Verrucomicrobiota bacterium JB024]